MQFVPVSSSELKQFDAETIQLYRKRDSDPRLTETLLKLNRKNDRSSLPAVANPLTEWQKDRESYLRWFPIKSLAFMAFFVYAQRQFTKAYFPYGIILRRSIPTTLAQQISFRAPIGLVFLTLWYYQREYPRS